MIEASSDISLGFFAHDGWTHLCNIDNLRYTPLPHTHTQVSDTLPFCLSLTFVICKMRKQWLSLVTRTTDLEHDFHYCLLIWKNQKKSMISVIFTQSPWNLKFIAFFCYKVEFYIQLFFFSQSWGLKFRVSHIWSENFKNHNLTFSVWCSVTSGKFSEREGAHHKNASLLSVSRMSSTNFPSL